MHWNARAQASVRHADDCARRLVRFIDTATAEHAEPGLANGDANLKHHHPDADQTAKASEHVNFAAGSGRGMRTHGAGCEAAPATGSVAVDALGSIMTPIAEAGAGLVAGTVFVDVGAAAKHAVEVCFAHASDSAACKTCVSACIRGRALTLHKHQSQMWHALKH